MISRALAAATASAIAASVLLLSVAPRAQVRGRAVRMSPDTITDLRAEDARVNRMQRGGRLRLRHAVADKLLPGRRIERLAQYHAGVRVYGADVARQVASGQIVSILGVVYEDIDVNVNPTVAEIEARRIVETRAGVSIGPLNAGELVVLPLDEGGYALTWRIRAFTGTDLRQYFVDARSGRIVFDYSDLQTQTAVGRATGVLGDSKKISVLPTGGMFLAQDGLRPPDIRTYDMQGNPDRVDAVLNGLVQLTTADLAADSDNVWTDGAAGDAHVYAGYTYDYFFSRFARRGLNDDNIAMRSMVHPIRRDMLQTHFDSFPEFFSNAFYAGNGYMVYGVGLPTGRTQSGRSWDFVSGALDVVAHELAHGVTDYTSNLIYRNESGALNESFSDIMGTSVEFFFQPAGDGLLQADYTIAEDVVRAVSASTNGIRSMANPAAYGHPDHYSVRFTGTSDNGGVHINSGIPNHAFYLAVEGGTNRVSGLTVQGVGPANRVQIETAFYRAFTQLLPSNATFVMARAATIQAALDLYGSASVAVRAITDAWTAVGVE